MEKATLVFENVGEGKIEVIDALINNLMISVTEATAIINNCPCKITDLPLSLAADLKDVICNRKGFAYVQHQRYAVYKFKSSIASIH